MGAAPRLPPSGFDDLSPDEKFEYINALWSRLVAHPETVPIPDWHREIVAERLAEYRVGRAGAGRTWAEVRQDLQSELRKKRG